MIRLSSAFAHCETEFGMARKALIESWDRATKQNPALVVLVQVQVPVLDARSPPIPRRRGRTSSPSPRRIDPTARQTRTLPARRRASFQPSRARAAARSAACRPPSCTGNSKRLAMPECARSFLGDRTFGAPRARRPQRRGVGGQLSVHGKVTNGARSGRRRRQSREGGQRRSRKSGLLCNGIVNLSRSCRRSSSRAAACIALC